MCLDGLDAWTNTELRFEYCSVKNQKGWRNITQNHECVTDIYLPSFPLIESYLDILYRTMTEYTGVYCTQYTHNNQLVFLGISALVHANDTYALSEVDSEQFDFGYISITTTIKL